MNINLIEPRGGRIQAIPSLPSPPLDRVSHHPGPTEQGQTIELAPPETHYFIVTFPGVPIPYEEPDTERETTLSDLRGISRRSPRAAEGPDPEPGWPEGWR